MAVKSTKAGGLPSIKSTVNELIKSKQVRQNMLNLYKVNKHKGFDCPGCAWGDEKDGTFRFCENGAKAVAWESTELTIGAEFFRQHSVTYLNKQSDHWLESQGRLAEPLRYNAATDHYEPVSWDDAFDIIAAKLNGLNSPDELELYTSGRASNEASFVYQLFGRAFGTNNFPDCSNMCHEASGIALNQSVGVGKGTVVLKDFEKADTLFVFGQNPGTNHPRMLNALRAASKRGATIVSVNNLKEVGLQKFASPQKPAELLGLETVQISSKYVSPKLGGDYAVARGMAKAILMHHKDRLDHEFITSHTSGFDAYASAVEATSWQSIEKQSGLSQSTIEELAALFSASRKTISTWAMGITQHLYSVDTIKEIVSLHLLTGALGLPGAGLSPVRGHSNVQGNRTMGILEAPKPDFNQRMKETFGFNPPEKPGHRVFDMLSALHEKRSKVLICLGGNLVAAAADTPFTAAAAGNAELLVNIATKLNRTHVTAKQDALLLPCLGRTEIDMQATGNQVITVEDTFSMVHGSSGSTPPQSNNLKSETEIICRIAAATLGENTPADWLSLSDDYSLIRDLIAKVIPGFENMNDKIAEPGGFHLYNAAAKREWRNKEGKALFNHNALPENLFSEGVMAKIAASDTPVFTMQTLRSHDQYNTTIYGMNDRYRGIFGERNIVFMNPQDLARLNIREGSLINVETVWDDDVTRKISRFKAISYDIPQGNVAAYYPEANPLVPFNSVGQQSATPTSKAVPVIITPVNVIA